MIDDLTGIRILILGGAGFIGQNLARALLQSGAELRCLDRSYPQSNRVVSVTGRKPEWIIADLSDEVRVSEALVGVDYVFHLVSTTIPATSNNDPQYDLSSNVLPTLKLLDAVKSTAVKKIIFISSGGTVYGIPKVTPIPESHETEPICAYGIHKLAIEKYLRLYHYNFGLDYCILRLANPYGITQISDRPQGVIGKFVYKAIHRERLDIWGDGSVVRDYIYMDDVLAAALSALRYRGAEKIFNVGSGKGHSLREIIGIIEMLGSRPLEVNFLPARQADLPLNVLDISRIRAEFGWYPRMDIDSGIREMIEYGFSAREPS